jgi:hypothetical protein
MDQPTSVVVGKTKPSMEALQTNIDRRLRPTLLLVKLFGIGTCQCHVLAVELQSRSPLLFTDPSLSQPLVQSPLRTRPPGRKDHYENRNHKHARAPTHRCAKGMISRCVFLFIQYTMAYFSRPVSVTNRDALVYLLYNAHCKRRTCLTTLSMTLSDYDI